MADAMTLVKAPSEKMSEFNKRLRAACEDQDVTDVQILVVDGEPVVTLFNETVEATQEDVDEVKEAGGEPIKVGDLIAEEPPIIAQVTKVGCATDDLATKTQARMENLFERAEGNVTKILHAIGSQFGWVESPDKKYAYCETQQTYLLVCYLPVDEEDDDSEDAKMEQSLRPAKDGK